jgi:CheY-like chemotaxis protein
MPAPKAPLRVLVVDDNHLIRRLLMLILEEAGFAPVEAESAEDAIELAHDAPPSAWLVDDVMPGMRGSELIRLVRRSRDPRFSGAAVVGVSGRMGARADLLAAGADTFVAKPVDERSVLAALGKALALRRSNPDHLPAA